MLVNQLFLFFNVCSFFGGTDDEPVDFGLPNFPRNPTSAELAEPAKHLTEKGASSQIWCLLSRLRHDQNDMIKIT